MLLASAIYVVFFILAVFVWATDGNSSTLDFPDFFVIGAMKCGTTSLNKLMYDHPSICDYGDKEKHFFDKDEYDTDYDEHLESYESEFSGCKKRLYKIDSTPSYIQYPYVPARINESYTRDDLLRKRFLLVIREPVSRFYSQYQMRLRVCFKGLYWTNSREATDDDETKLRLHRNCKGVMHNYTMHLLDEPKKHHRFRSFSEWVRESEDGVEEISRGYYLDHIQDWLKYVPRNIIFIVDFADLIARTNSTMFNIASFLSIEPEEWFHSGGAHFKVNGVTLPKPKYQKPEFANGALDCATFDWLVAKYNAKNPNLKDFINNASGQRPMGEPLFAGWNYTTRHCSPTSQQTVGPANKHSPPRGKLKVH